MQVSTHVGHGGPHELPQGVVIGDDGGRGVVAEPEGVVRGVASSSLGDQ